MNRTQDPHGNPLDPRDGDGLGRHEGDRLAAGRDGHTTRHGHDGRPGDHVVHDSTIEKDHHNRRAGHIGSGYGNPDTAATPVRQKGGFGLGLAALILGILALLLSWVPALGVVAAVILGLLAIVLGFVARGRARRTNGSGRGLGVAGIVLGLLSLIVAALVTFGMVKVFGNSNLDECLRDAGTDQAKIEKCSQDFADDVSGSNKN